MTEGGHIESIRETCNETLIEESSSKDPDEKGLGSPRGFITAGLTAAGDRGKNVAISVTDDEDNESVMKFGDDGLAPNSPTSQEEIILEDDSPAIEGLEEESDSEAESDAGEDQAGSYTCADPSSLVVRGQGIKLHALPNPETLGEVKEHENSEQLEDAHSLLASELIKGPRRQSLSPVIEEDYGECWSRDISEVDGSEIDCGAGDATGNVDTPLMKGDDDYTNELSKALSSEAVNAALAEINYEKRLIDSSAGCADDLDDSGDDVVVIVPEPHELNYDNVPDGVSLEYSLQDAANARIQLDAQADFLENSLNCLEVTLDRMSLNEAVMPDGSVVFLKDQLRKGRTGHLLRAWEKARGTQNQYISDEDLDKPLSLLQKEVYQDQIKNVNSANDELRTSVTQATLQEQALRGQGRQMQQTYGGLEQNISTLSQELIGLQSRQKELQTAMMEERRAKEIAQRENEIVYRRDSSELLPQSREVSYEDHVGSYRQSHRSRSASSTDEVHSTADQTPSPYYQTPHPRWRREQDIIHPPSWRRWNRPPLYRRASQAPRSWGNNWKWNGPRGGPPRAWERERRRPPFPARPFSTRPRPPPIPFTQPFKKETEFLLHEYFNKMGRVENLLRERGFAKGPAAEAPVPVVRPRPPPRSHQGYQYNASRSGGSEPPFRRGRLASRSMPSMGGPYRDRSNQSAGWFESSRSQTAQHAQSDVERRDQATNFNHDAPQAEASA